jgi:hypothetical protein
MEVNDHFQGPGRFILVEKLPHTPEIVSPFELFGEERNLFSCRESGSAARSLSLY